MLWRSSVPPVSLTPRKPLNPRRRREWMLLPRIPGQRPYRRSRTSAHRNPVYRSAHRPLAIVRLFGLRNAVPSPSLRGSTYMKTGFTA